MPRKKNTCRYCRKELPEGALFCPWCGEKQVGAKKREPKYPAYRVLADGSLMGQLMINGQRETIKADSEKEYRAKIDGLRAGVIELKKHPEKRPLKDIVRAYIDKNDGVLSPATIMGYDGILQNRFRAYMTKPVCEIDFQAMVNEEAKQYAPKTVKNAWALISSALKASGNPIPELHTPQVPESDEDFLDYEQIQLFLKEIHGDIAECAALLMLHSLRTSELLMLDVSDIKDGKILVRGAVVPNKEHKLVEKQTNKNRTSRRDVPIMILRLEEILPQSGKAVTIAPTTFRRHILDACERAGLPPCSPHDLRRSFASLAKHLKWDPETLMRVGGWNNMETVNKIYAKLAEQDKNADVQKMVDYYRITTAAEKTSNSA